MWTNDTDSIFTGTERTFADDWASTAQVAPASAERRGVKRTATLALAALAAATMLTGCSVGDDVKPEGAMATYAQRDLKYATDPCPGKVIKMDEADPVWCGQKVSNMSEQERADARATMEKMMADEMGGAIDAIPTPTEAPTEAPAPTATETAAPVDDFAGVHAFGDTVTTGLGNDITVDGPVKFNPSSTATSTGPAVKFKITFKNDGDTPVDLSSTFTATAARDDKEAESVWDSENEVSVAPSTAVRPGKTVTFWIAFEGKLGGEWNLDIDGAGEAMMFSGQAPSEKKAEAPSKPAKATKKDAPAEESEWVKGQREWAAMTEAERAAELDMNEALTAPEGDVGADDIDADEEMNGELVWDE